MKNKMKYLLYGCNFILVVFIVLNILTYHLESNKVTTYALGLEDRSFISYLTIDNIKEQAIIDGKLSEEAVEDKINIIIGDKEVLNQGEELTYSEVKEKTLEELPDENMELSDDEESFEVIETLVGSLVGYGPDCYGCTSFRTASGKYIGDGNIYYEDDTYGKIRIVAGDSSYPFGTIVRISNVDFYHDEPFYAVVLDRGGDIGKNGKFLFDLLFPTENEAYQLGKEVNIKFEIMRLGY